MADTFALDAGCQSQAQSPQDTPAAGGQAGPAPGNSSALSMWRLGGLTPSTGVLLGTSPTASCLVSPGHQNGISPWDPGAGVGHRQRPLSLSAGEHFTSGPFPRVLSPGFPKGRRDDSVAVVLKSLAYDHVVLPSSLLSSLPFMPLLLLLSA